MDRIAFAAKFLSDKALVDYLDREWHSLLARGRLEGLLLSRGAKTFPSSGQSQEFGQGDGLDNS